MSRLTTPDGNTIPIGYLYNREFTYDNYDEEACAYEIEVEEISAALDNGVLTISAPKKKPEVKETKIKIPLA